MKNAGPLAAGRCVNEDCPGDTQDVSMGIDPATGYTVTRLQCTVCDTLWILT